jgi:hypothetical protein
MKTVALLLLAGLMPVACHKSDPPPPLAAVSATPVASVAPLASAADPTAAATDSAAAAAPVAAVAAKIPTPADYEVQANSAITPANASQVLTAIDKEVGQ